jgi:DNA-directed RNA polymerase III subunit RPC5
MDIEDDVVQTLPVRLSFGLSDKLHIHQYPLLSRPLQVPQNAAASGKRISSRIKPNARRIEIHVPADTRSDVWNKDRAVELGAARLEDDREKNQGAKGRVKEEDPRLNEFRMSSEQIPQRGIHMLGIIHEGKICDENIL